MEITRLTSPTFPAVSDAEIETWLRIDAGQDSGTIEMLVASATEYVEALTGRAIGLASYTVEYDDIELTYRLPFTPVTAISKIEYRDDSGALVLATGWTRMGSTIQFADYPLGAPVVTLEAGFSNPASVQAALRHAIAVLVSAGYNGREEMSDQTAKTVDRLCQPHKRYF